MGCVVSPTVIRHRFTTNPIIYLIMNNDVDLTLSTAQLQMGIVTLITPTPTPATTTTTTASHAWLEETTEQGAPQQLPWLAA